MSGIVTQNLAQNHVSAPQASQTNLSKDAAGSKPVALTKNGILQISEVPIQKFQKNQSFVLQIIYNKVFDTEQQKATRKQNEEGNEGKSKPKLIIASKLALSDGVSQIKAMIPEQSYNKLVQKPKQHDVIEITAFQRLQVNDQDLLMLKDPIKIWYDDVSSTIGSPKDFKEIKQKYKRVLDENANNVTEITERECADLGQTFYVQASTAAESPNKQGDGAGEELVGKNAGQQLQTVAENTQSSPVPAQPQSQSLKEDTLMKVDSQHKQQHNSGSSNAAAEAPQSAAAQPQNQVPQQAAVQKESANKRYGEASMSNNDCSYTPIKALTTFSRDWIIQARVVQKSDLRNTRNGGKLFKIVLIDKHNTHIEATFFNDTASHFYPQIQENRVYLFSNGYVKMANKKFTSVKNDYCLTFEMRSLIEAQSDNGTISRHSFDFTPINQLKEVFQQKTIDVVGIVINVEEKEQIKLKSGEYKSRKFLEIVDDSMCSIGVTCWGDNLCNSQYNLKAGDLLAIKSARLSDYSGKSLNLSDEQSQVFNEVDDDVAKRIQKWFARVQAEARSEGLSIPQKLENIDHLTQRQSRSDNQFGSGGQESNKFHSNLICEIEEQFRNENDIDKGHLFTINGYVARIKNPERIYYLACPMDNCRKKVSEEGDGHYQCHNCSKKYNHCKATYMINAKISDFTGSLYVNFTREQGEAIIGMPAEEFKNREKDWSDDERQEFFDQLMFKQYNILIRGRMEPYQGEQRTRYFAIKVQARSSNMGQRILQNENKTLLERLTIYKDMPNKEQQNAGGYGGGMNEEMKMDDGGQQFNGFTNYM